jgi:hypothetical protein
MTNAGVRLMMSSGTDLAIYCHFSKSIVPKTLYLKVAGIAIDLQQCWFPGAHHNIGGGYPDNGLADIALAWMVDRCRPFLDFESYWLSRIVATGRKPGESQRNKEI